MASGKTTVQGLLHLTATYLTNRDPRFFANVYEGTFGVREAQSELCMGKFPDPTPMGTIYEATLMMRWKSFAGEKVVRLPFVETAGEEIQKLIDRFGRGLYDLTPGVFKAANILYEHILSSSGFILIMPVTRIPAAQNLTHDTEPSNLSPNPDVNISRLIQCIQDYKTRTKIFPIRGYAIIFTKSDKMFDVLASQGMNLLEEDGIRRFMTAHMPQTYAILKWYGLSKVLFLPSWVEQEYDGNEEVLWPDGRPKIKVNHSENIPEYPQANYLQLIQWLKNNFAG